MKSQADDNNSIPSEPDFMLNIFYAAIFTIGGIIRLLAGLGDALIAAVSCVPCFLIAAINIILIFKKNKEYEDECNRLKNDEIEKK